MDALEGVIGSLRPIDRRVLLAAFSAGARVNVGTPVADVLRSIPSGLRNESSVALSELRDAPQPLVVEWETGTCFLTPLGIQCVVRLRAEEAEEELPPPQELPFTLSNPTNRSWHAEPRFLDEIDWRDGRLGGALSSKMSRILQDPTSVAKPMQHYRDGRRTCQVTKNKRLIYRIDGETVVFMRFLSREDPDYT